MMVYVANPLYDAVFKYLMEDERIAKTILSALLQKEVLEVKMRRNEYSNINRNAISMFRIDFAAKVKEKDGSQKLILIELQKTWLETETLRFRQYLALQYNNKENMTKESDNKYALPTVAVYLLGHRVGEINEPVVYAQHRIYDYEGKEVVLDQPDPFVESLQHDSIIVQIPLLRGKVNNHLERVLSVFDQTLAYEEDRRVLRVDESQYAGDGEMEYIVHRLQSAAADPEMRYQMNAEAEFFKALEDRDTAIMEQAKLIEKKDADLLEQEKTIKQKDADLLEQEKAIKQKDADLLEQEKAIKQKDADLLEQEKAIKQKDADLLEQEKAIKQKDADLFEQQEMLRRMVENLTKNGMDDATVMKMTGLTEEQIRKLK